MDSVGRAAARPVCGGVSVPQQGGAPCRRRGPRGCDRTPVRAARRRPENGMPPRFRPLLALFLVALLAPATAVRARDQKTVFHGLPVEPDTGFLKPRDVTPIILDPAWVYEGFAAPLAGDAAEVGMQVVASDQSGRVVSIDIVTGSAVWTVELGEALPIGPAVASDLILQGTTNGLLVALGAVDGRERWRTTLGAAPAALPIVEGARLLIVTQAPELVSIDFGDGRVLSRLPLPGAPFAPALGPDGVVIGTASGQLVAAGGDPLEIQWTRELGHPITGPALVDRKHVLVATADRALWSLR